jgi:predicted small integral membrane protein
MSLMDRVRSVAVIRHRSTDRRQSQQMSPATRLNCWAHPQVPHAVSFMSIGGEWFDMWMSTKWNGEQSAFRSFATLALVLIFVSLRNDDIAE